MCGTSSSDSGVLSFESARSTDCDNSLFSSQQKLRIWEPHYRINIDQILAFAKDLEEEKGFHSQEFP